jgi:hypothetical protein
VAVGDKIDAEDLLVEIEPAEPAKNWKKSKQLSHVCQRQCRVLVKLCACIMGADITFYQYCLPAFAGFWEAEFFLFFSLNDLLL